MTVAPVVLKPEGPTLPPEMLVTLLLGVAALTVLYFAFVTRRYALARVVDLRAQAAAEADDA